MIRGPLKIRISHIPIYIYIRVGPTASKHLIVRAFGQKFGKIRLKYSRDVCVR